MGKELIDSSSPKIVESVPIKKFDEYAKLRADRMTIDKDAIEVGDMKESESEDSEDSAKAMERHVEAATDAPQTKAPESIWEKRFTLLEEDVSVMRASMQGLNMKIDEITIQNDKSEKKVMAWLRALGRACKIDTDIVSDTG
ncbi:hypothetical protein HAX54_039658 [Datura stramonium]|uniref:Uncharacterized protein n=1 Tax=Datura stramonium TaxID=4076 RepID=A0ABS8SJF2_DATST|nr:hypothetical protein [Datura stramonium]